MLGNGPARQFAATAVTVAALAALLTACDSSGPTAKPTTAAASSNLCGVQLTTDTRRALLYVLGSKKFTTSESTAALGNTARALVSSYKEKGPDDSAVPEEHELCTAYAPAADFGVKLSFYLRGSVPSSTALLSMFTQYEMGELALSRQLNAYLYMKCSSDSFSSNGDSVLIVGKLKNPLAVDSDDVNLREMNMNVLHAVSLAMVKELGCKGDAGLSARFSARSSVQPPPDRTPSPALRRTPPS
ncbi:hypothetical protein [Streptomyces sp. MBT62]|uniref:hypothetical protein n=1 Tax=Streptomyces sp. MBT62 TaxID=2800410 RepID=UPI00190C533B|nr:hypothetical protein [Streptomyces sp. MBT62]MBK3567341.1 hypothetical protein [Streptomyces sp. MBT62]